MRLPDHAHRVIPLFAAIVVAGLLVSARAVYADDGDEKCSKKGEIWVDDLESRAWQNVGGHCVPKGPGGPANGDRKCGVSGFTVKYVASIDRWLNTRDHCHGGSNDVHLENLHSGTTSETPSGWGDHVSAPGVP